MARDYAGRRALHVTFGRDGLVADWSVFSGVDRYGFECPVKPSSYAPRPRPAAVIRGRAIFFAAGIQGAAAWMCVPAGVVGNAKRLQVELWYDIRLDSTEMRRRAMYIVASARLVRPA